MPSTILKTDEGDIWLPTIESGRKVIIDNTAYVIYNYNGDIRKYEMRANPVGRPKCPRSCKTDEGKILLSDIVSGSIHKINGIDYKIYIINNRGILHFNKVLVREPQKRGPKKKTFL